MRKGRTTVSLGSEPQDGAARFEMTSEPQIGSGKNLTARLPEVELAVILCRVIESIGAVAECRLRARTHQASKRSLPNTANKLETLDPRARIRDRKGRDYLLKWRAASAALPPSSLENSEIGWGEGRTARAAADYWPASGSDCGGQSSSEGCAIVTANRADPPDRWRWTG